MQCEQVWREAVLRCPQDAALWRALIAAVVLFFKMWMGWKKEDVGICVTSPSGELALS